MFHIIYIYTYSNGGNPNNTIYITEKLTLCIECELHDFLARELSVVKDGINLVRNILSD